MKGPRNNKSKSSAPAPRLAMPGVDTSQLEKLLDFMAAHGLEEFEYEHGGLHIRLRKAPSAIPPAPRTAAAATMPAAAAPAGPAAIQEPASAPAPAAEDLHLIKSPIVGTFYGAPSPEAPPFVRVGDSVQTGQVVCIVEAMKLMNEIEADINGEIVQVLAENGQPVEYGQPLFAVRPARKK